MRSLITGGGGFVGSTLDHRLLAEGHRIGGIDNLGAGVAANLEADFTVSG
jgi:UDP-glucose 4-epimerase